MKIPGIILAAVALCFGAEAKTLEYSRQLTTVSWSQYMPHSNFLPQYAANSTDSVTEGAKSGKVAAGCAATAYVQLAAFHQWPVLIDDTIHAYSDHSCGADTQIDAVAHRPDRDAQKRRLVVRLRNQWRLHDLFSSQDSRGR